jgi:hypothetical protein
MEMLCKIADLIAEIPTADGLAVRCKDYLHNETAVPDIVVSKDRYRWDIFPTNTLPETVAYMESGAQFCRQLLKYDGFYLHASAVVRNGKAYLFSGHSGAGKSTHARLWVNTFGGDTHIINDDKPILRCVNGIWYAYGAPWCGKDGINLNEKAPLAGICFLKQAPHNRIRAMAPAEAMQSILGQTIHRLDEVQQLDALLHHLEGLISQIPVYELENCPEPAAAQLSYETMLRGALEAKL